MGRRWECDATGPRQRVARAGNASSPSLKPRCRRETRTSRGNERICVMNVMSYNMVHNVLEFLRCVVASLREPVFLVATLEGDSWNLRSSYIATTGRCAPLPRTDQPHQHRHRHQPSDALNYTRLEKSYNTCTTGCRGTCRCRHGLSLWQAGNQYRYQIRVSNRANAPLLFLLFLLLLLLLLSLLFLLLIRVTGSSRR